MSAIIKTGQPLTKRITCLPTGRMRLRNFWRDQIAAVRLTRLRTTIGDAGGSPYEPVVSTPHTNLFTIPGFHTKGESFSSAG